MGIDYDSFSLRGGDPYFQKAWNIVNNAPEGGDITGWKQFDGLRNRYFLAENLNNSRFALMHDAIYTYYRIGLDNFFEKEDEARLGIINSLNYLNTINTENPNSMIMQFFFQGKNNELIKMFSRANPDVKKRARDLLNETGCNKCQRIQGHEMKFLPGILLLLYFFCFLFGKRPEKRHFTRKGNAGSNVGYDACRPVCSSFFIKRFYTH